MAEPLGSEFPIEKAASASLDRKGALFVATATGTVNKYSSDGEFELTFSAARNSKIGLVEAWTTLDIMVFYAGFQSVTLLNRFLAPITEISLRDKVGFARLVTSNYESNLWVIDDSDFSLKLIDLTLDQVTINTPFNQVLDPESYDISFLREYQNLLFIVDQSSGVLVFDNLGNYLRKISVGAGIEFVGFLNNELYYSRDQELVFIDIYTGDRRSLPLPSSGLVLATASRIFLLKGSRVELYSY